MAFLKLRIAFPRTLSDSFIFIFINPERGGF